MWLRSNIGSTLTVYDFMKNTATVLPRYKKEFNCLQNFSNDVNKIFKSSDKNWKIGKLQMTNTNEYIGAGHVLQR